MKENIWRVIYHQPCHGAMNMAIDEAIMEAHRAGKVPPTLRFYSWNPPAISLGYFQKLAKEINIEACHRQGIDVVRRSTGGRAVLHEHELTYSLVIQEDDPMLPPSLMGAYQAISQGLLRGLNALGVAAELAAPGGNFGNMENPLPKNGACFDAPAFYEIGVNGKKLIGSAQVRRKGTLLQHGSLLIRFSAEKLVELLCFSSVQEKEFCLQLLNNKVTYLEKELLVLPTLNELVKQLGNGLAEHFEICLEPGELTTAEQERAVLLEKEKFGSELWTSLK